jgi:hypothetical protein
LRQALAACNQSLLAASRLIREHKGDLDADLFLVSYRRVFAILAPE